MSCCVFLLSCIQLMCVLFEYVDCVCCLFISLHGVIVCAVSFVVVLGSFNMFEFGCGCRLC